MKARIPFDISYRDKVESGEVEVTTYDGRRVKILQWDINSDKPIVAVIQRDIPDTGKDEVVCYSEIGTQQNGVGPSDLVMVIECDYAERLIDAITLSAQLTSCLQKHGFDVDELISWLKQQKSKTEDKIREFKVGDVLRRKSDGCHATVIQVKDGNVQVRSADWDEWIINKQWELVEDPISDDIEIEIKKMQEEFLVDDPNTIGDITGESIAYIARHFAKWQKKKMMNDAVDAEIVGIKKNMLNGSFGYAEIEGNYNTGDKVKLIILKDQ